MKWFKSLLQTQQQMDKYQSLINYINSNNKFINLYFHNIEFWVNNISI